MGEVGGGKEVVSADELATSTRLKRLNVTSKEGKYHRYRNNIYRIRLVGINGRVR